MITLVVAIVSILPPILHFLTGPVGPAIGGFIACRTMKLTERDALLMGGVLAIVSGLPAYYFLRDVSFLGGGSAVVAAVIAAVYVAGLATFAAIFAVADEPERQEAEESASAD